MDEAYKLMLAYSEVEGDMLPHLEDFLADYNRGQRERVDHVPEKTAVEDAIAVRLEHLRMDVEARVPELRDLLREQLDTIDRVAEDDRLVDL